MMLAPEFGAKVAGPPASGHHGASKVRRTLTPGSSAGPFAAAMVMLGAASPQTLRGYETGIKALSKKWSHLGGWPRICWADVQVRSQHWDRILEDGLASSPPTFDHADPMVWDAVIACSAFQSACRGALAGWWEDNLTFDLDHPHGQPRQQQAAPPQLPAPAPTLALQDAAPSSRGATGFTGSGRESGQTGGEPCANCGTGNHAWWNCTFKTGTPMKSHLAAVLTSKGLSPKGKGKNKSKDSGGKGKGGGGGKGHAAIEDASPRTPVAGDGDGHGQKKKKRKTEARAKAPTRR